MFLPELWLGKCSLGISFINTNLPNNRIKMIKSKEEIELSPDNSTDIYKKSIIDLIGTWIGQHVECLHH